MRARSHRRGDKDGAIARLVNAVRVDDVLLTTAASAAPHGHPPHALVGHQVLNEERHIDSFERVAA